MIRARFRLPKVPITLIIKRNNKAAFNKWLGPNGPWTECAHGNYNRRRSIIVYDDSETDNDPQWNPNNSKRPIILLLWETTNIDWDLWLPNNQTGFGRSTREILCVSPSNQSRILCDHPHLFFPGTRENVCVTTGRSLHPKDYNDGDRSLDARSS